MKYLLEEDVWISDNYGEEVWFLLLEERVCNQHSYYPDAKTMLLQSLGFV